LESLAKKAVTEKQPFERLIVSKENLLKMFAVSPKFSLYFYVIDI